LITLQMVPSLTDSAFNNDPGSLSSSVHIRTGYYLLASQIHRHKALQ
jgi:hypothetical protein